MGKYIDKMPPSGGDPKQIEDYLAYLKDQLNFIFDNYWRNIKGAVTFESLKEPGKTVIDGGNVITGKLASENGDFYVDLKTGEVLLKNAIITGGRVQIETDSATFDVIEFDYEVDGLSRKIYLSPSWLRLQKEYEESGTPTKNDIVTSDEGVRLIRYKNGDTPVAFMYATPDGFECAGEAGGARMLSDGSLEITNYVDRVKAILNKNGLTFITDDVQTAFYPAVQ